VIQEACILHVPCLTLGKATEWAETVEVGANQVCGTEPGAMVDAAALAASGPRDWEVPFVANSASRVVDVLVDALG